jgi:hypothetical protein
VLSGGDIVSSLVIHLGLGVQDATMREAEHRVTEFARRLESTDNDAVVGSILPRGKVERYLALYRPWHYDLLTKHMQAASKSKAKSS